MKKNLNSRTAADLLEKYQFAGQVTGTVIDNVDECQRCHKKIGEDKNGWLIVTRFNDDETGIQVVRCPDHITDYALKQVGKK